MERSYIASLLDGSLLGKIPLITMPMGESAAFSRTKDSCSGGMFSGADCFVGTAFKTENLAYKGHLYLINLSENKVTWIENPALDQGQNYLKTHAIGDERALVFQLHGKSPVRAML